MKNFLLLTIILVLSGCESAEEKQAKLDKQVLDVINNAFKNVLTDPSSLQLRNLKGYCGEANSKNKLGGYDGFNKFIVLREDSVVFQTKYSTSTKEFTRGWEKICKEKPQFNKNNQLIKPNYKLPEAVYDPPHFESNGITITTTPNRLSIDGDYNYIYPVLMLTCDEKNKLDLTLISYMDPAFKNNGYHMFITSPNKKNSGFIIPMESSNQIQDFKYNKEKLFSFLKANDEVTFYFDSISGHPSIQTYDLKPVKQALKDNKLKCNW